jgi:hypothetical protein
MPLDESVIRALLARIKDAIEMDHPNLGYAVALFEAGEDVFYAPVNYVTNLDAEGIRGIGGFLIEEAAIQSLPGAEEQQGPEEETDSRS